MQSFCKTCLGFQHNSFLVPFHTGLASLALSMAHRKEKKKKIQLTFVFLLFLITFLEYISFFKSGFPVGKPFFSVHYYYHFFLLLFKIMIALREKIPLRKMSFRLQETLCCVPSSQRRGDSSLKAHKAHSNYYLQQPGRRACTHRKADSTRIH